MDLIVIVGVGGIGSNLFQKLARYAPINYNILLVDGDTVEAKNIERQCFTKNDIGKNKAECLAHKANNQLLNRFKHYPYYLETKNMDKLAKQFESIIPRQHGKTIIFGCVDNHPTRKALEHILSENEVMLNREWLYIDGANERYTGDVVSCRNSYINYKLKISGAFRSAYDYNVMIDASNDPNNSCQELLSQGDIQTLIANDKVAVLMLEVFNNYLNGKGGCVGLWQFDACKTMKT